MFNKEGHRRDLLRMGGLVTGSAGLPMLMDAAQVEGSAGRNTPVLFDVRGFGAKGDGKSIDSPAINNAIDAAAKAGGGTVYFPGGMYLSYSIHLKSAVALYLDQGVQLIAADSKARGGSGDYDLAEPNQWQQYQDFGHNHWHNSLIWGEGIHDVSIFGPGLIWGKGLSKGYGPGPKAEQQGVGNKTIALKNCRNVVLRDFSILKGGHFGILATGVDNLTIDNLKIDTDRDGMDIDCCRNVRVSNCTVNSPWDDGICLKSSYALGENRSTDMVTITNCLVSGSYQLGAVLDGSFRKFAPDFRVPRTGRIKFGTESNGGFRNITISNCAFDGCQGLALESVDGALLEDVTITNISMRDITSSPIFLRLGRRMRAPQGMKIGTLKRILLSNIVCSNSASRTASAISGIPEHNIEDVKLHDIYIQIRGGGTKEMGEQDTPEQETAYPEPGRFYPMPANGFYIRHVRNIEMSNIEISTLTPDERPTFVLEDVHDASFFRVKAPAVSGTPMFRLKDVEDLDVARCKPAPEKHLSHVEKQDL